MYLHSRLRRLERSTIAIATAGPPCAVCANGIQPHAVVARIEGKNLDEPVPPCPGRGRENAVVIRLVRAVPPPGWAGLPSPI